MSQRQFCQRTRREFLWEAGGGFAGTALTGMLAADGFFGPRAATAAANASGGEKAGGSQAGGSAVTGSYVNPMAPKLPHFAPKATSVIFLFMYGGPSHIETFEYKPKLYPLDGKTIPVKTFGRGGRKNEGRVVGPKWLFQPSGQCGGGQSIHGGGARRRFDDQQA